MRDTSLRELERRWRESGGVAEEAAWLHAKVQTGQLKQSRLRLAAYLLHEGARLAVSRPVPVLRKGQSAFLESLLEVDKSQETVVRAVIAAGRSVERNPAQSRLLGLELAEQWCVAARDEERESLVEEALGFSGWQGNRNASPVHRAAVFATLSVSTTQTATWQLHALESLSGAMEAVLGPGRSRLSERPMPPRLREAIHGEIVPWALGYGDPVRERIEARTASTQPEC